AEAQRRLARVRLRASRRSRVGARRFLQLPVQLRRRRLRQRERRRLHGRAQQPRGAARAGVLPEARQGRRLSHGGLGGPEPDDPAHGHRQGGADDRHRRRMGAARGSEQVGGRRQVRHGIDPARRRRPPREPRGSLDRRHRAQRADRATEGGARVPHVVPDARPPARIYALWRGAGSRRPRADAARAGPEVPLPQGAKRQFARGQDVRGHSRSSPDVVDRVAAPQRMHHRQERAGRSAQSSGRRSAGPDRAERTQDRPAAGSQMKVVRAGAAAAGEAIALPRLGYGGGSLFTVRTERDATQLLAYAYDRGFRYFDTAPLYSTGLGEHFFGTALRQRRRDEFVLSTKVGRRLTPRCVNPPPEDRLSFEPWYDYSYDGVMRALEDSLQRLGLCRADIVFIHDVNPRWQGADYERRFVEAMEG